MPLKKGTVCKSCAKDHNLQWPKGHKATFSNTKCDQCEKEKGCCSTEDYLQKLQK